MGEAVIMFGIVVLVVAVFLAAFLVVAVPVMIMRGWVSDRSMYAIAATIGLLLIPFVCEIIMDLLR